MSLGRKGGPGSIPTGWRAVSEGRLGPANTGRSADRTIENTSICYAATEICGRGRTPARLLAFKLDGDGAIPEPGPPIDVPKPHEPRMAERLAAQGRVLFEDACVGCHGHYGDAVHGAIPNLLTRPPAIPSNRR